ncbi:MAG: DUF4351 domain-containing protein [Synechococcaceae cyanobacterium SM1_2_3]|nr:DUF4351 domain-containing protein [Synechococcaceae cyanobacterium SM1_2_3]
MPSDRQTLAQGARRLDGETLLLVANQTLSGGGELMTTIAEQWVQQGLQQGIDSERQLLLRMARRRFGAQAAEQSQSLLSRFKKPEQLEDLGELLLDCNDEAAWLAALNRRVDSLARQ